MLMLQYIAVMLQCVAVAQRYRRLGSNDVAWLRRFALDVRYCRLSRPSDTPGGDQAVHLPYWRLLPVHNLGPLRKSLPRWRGLFVGGGYYNMLLLCCSCTDVF